MPSGYAAIHPLKLLLCQYRIPLKTLAAAVRVHPATLSRQLNGQRRLSPSQETLLHDHVARLIREVTTARPAGGNAPTGGP